VFNGGVAHRPSNWRCSHLTQDTPGNCPMVCVRLRSILKDIRDAIPAVSPRALKIHTPRPKSRKKAQNSHQAAPGMSKNKILGRRLRARGDDSDGDNHTSYLTLAVVAFSGAHPFLDSSPATTLSQSCLVKAASRSLRGGHWSHGRRQLLVP
jgi:hypothetical protein